MFSIVYNLWSMVEDVIVQYIDIDYTLWLTWLMLLLITFVLLHVPTLLLFLNALMWYICKLYRSRLRNVSDTAWEDTFLYIVASVWDAYGWIWHGYKIVGLENIPQDQPVLFIYYHGAYPIDIYLFMAKIFLYNPKFKLHLVADRFVFKVPGLSPLVEFLRLTPGTVQSCSAVLKEGNIVGIAPGGLYEGQFGDSYYELMWKNRMGFAKVALDAKVSIIPLFTKNLRESYRTVSWGRRIWLKIYDKTKLPLKTTYGGFPVKLVTYLGKPIPYDENITPEELQIKVADSLRDLMRKHQKIPGNIIRALIERIRNTEKHKD